MTGNNENVYINDMSQGIIEKFDELELYKTVIIELVNCGEITLVRKIMRINDELASKTDIKLLNKKVKESVYRFTTKNGKIVLVKNSYVSVKNKISEKENEVLKYVKNKSFRSSILRIESPLIRDSKVTGI